MYGELEHADIWQKDIMSNIEHMWSDVVQHMWSDVVQHMWSDVVFETYYRIGRNRKDDDSQIL